MDKQTQEKITKAIEESLPQQVGDTLQRRLREADALDDQVVSMRDQIARLEATAKQKEADRAELVKIAAAAEAKIAAFSTREAAVATAERDILMANMLRQQADAVTNAVKETVQAFTKVPEIRRTHTVAESQGGMQAYNNGRQEFVPNGQNCTTETDTETTS